MTILAATRGDNETYQLTILDAAGAAMDITSVLEIWFTAKSSLDDADADAVIAKTKTGGGITIIDGPTGRADVALLPADTAGLAARRLELHWDCQVKAASGAITTVDSGTLVVSPDVTRAS